jgi:hypothetical protein
MVVRRRQVTDDREAAETRMAGSPTLLNRIGALRGTTHPFGLMSLIPPNECG